jgi:hypothetical protein
LKNGEMGAVSTLMMVQTRRTKRIAARQEMMPLLIRMDITNGLDKLTPVSSVILAHFSDFKLVNDRWEASRELCFLIDSSFLQKRCLFSSLSMVMMRV